MGISGRHAKAPGGSGGGGHEGDGPQDRSVFVDAVRVDGAIFISAFSMYRYYASYAVEVHRAHPGRFALVKPVDPVDPAVADVIADWKRTPGTVGIRIMMTKEATRTRLPRCPNRAANILHTASMLACSIVARQS